MAPAGRRQASPGLPRNSGPVTRAPAEDDRRPHPAVPRPRHQRPTTGAPTAARLGLMTQTFTRTTRPTSPGGNGARALPTFLVLSCLLSWWPAALGALGWAESGGLAGFGPLVAAVIVLGLTEGRVGVKDLLARMVRWRVAPRAYLLAISVPLVITAVAIILTVGSGAQVPDAAALSGWTQLPVVLVLTLMVPGMGGAWEEPGFRGYALGRLEHRFGLAAAPLILGGFWVVWPGPLFLTGDILWPDVIVVMAVSVVLASQLFSGGDAVRLHLFIALGWVLAAATTVMVSRRVQHERIRRGDRPRTALPTRPAAVTTTATTSGGTTSARVVHAAAKTWAPYAATRPTVVRPPR